MIKNLLIILFLGILVYACSDIFEEDLQDKVVVLLAPTDGFATDKRVHTFWWEKLEGALKYNLQIVKPSFDIMEEFILDTNITTNTFESQLSPGNYQWRVKAMNGSSETAYSVFSLNIDSTLTLNGQEVLLLNPANNAVLNDTNITFEWDKIGIEDGYKLLVKKESWPEGEIVVRKNELNTLLFDTTLLNEGTYYWAVQAYNDNSASTFNPKKFTLDVTKPNKPSLLTPANNAELTTETVTFTWQRSDDSGSDISDSLLIATDTTFTNGLIIKVTTDKESSVYFNISETKDYYWKVSATDEAGNWSGYSQHRKFTLKNAK